MHYRCWRTNKRTGKCCGVRVTLNQPLEHYKYKAPVCRACGNPGLKPDTYRMKHEVGPNAPKCYCDGLPFPHRPGCKWCHEYRGQYDAIDELHGQPTYKRVNGSPV
jgi:hypothetical protein